MLFYHIHLKNEIVVQWHLLSKQEKHWLTVLEQHSRRDPLNDAQESELLRIYNRLN